MRSCARNILAMPSTTGQIKDGSWRSCHYVVEDNHRPFNSNIARLFRRNVRYWHLADMPFCAAHVCF